MKATHLLASLSAVALGAFLAVPAEAITQCAGGGTAPTSGTKTVSCSSGASGRIRGSISILRVGADLITGSQLDVFGVNQNGT